METNKEPQKKSFSLDWLVGGVLTKLGDTFDRLTGRGWNPSSSLATSKLIEKLKFLLDSEVRDLGKDGKFIPHRIKLKIQWDKFSTESEQDLGKLEHELHAAAIDHINDRLYHTYAPLNIEIKTDYFTEGVKLLSSFGNFSDEEDDEVAVNVTVPSFNLNNSKTANGILVDLNEDSIVNNDDRFVVRFSVNERDFEIEHNFTDEKRASVGRSKNSSITINDQSVSKIHAALVLDEETNLRVADTGSTNGTFINGERISYGKAFAVDDDAKVKFGTVEVTFERIPKDVAEAVPAENEMVDEDKTDVFDAEVMAPVNEELDRQILPTEASVGLKETVAEVHPTQAAVDVIEPDEDDEIPDMPEEPVESENGEVVNLNETQDWEI